MCAKKYFYISYIGYSNTHNTKIYPSIVVNQLESYIQENFFYSKQSKKNNQLLHYSKYKKQITIQDNIHKKFFGTQIDYQDLIKFWIHPIKYFCQFQLNMYVPNKKKLITTTEPFLIDRLYVLKIKNIILNNLIEQKNDNIFFKIYQKSGILPYNDFGKIFWHNQKNDMNNIANIVSKFRMQTTHKIINLKIQKYHLHGLLLEIQKNGLLRWKPNNIIYSDRISLWLEHLIYCALGGKGESKIIGLKKKIWCFHPIDQDQAYKYLSDYIEGYIHGIQQPLFLTKSGFSWLDQVYNIKKKNITNDQVQKKIGYIKLLNTWHGNVFLLGEKHDVYINKKITELNNNYTKKICQTAIKWLLPILQHKKNIK